jgi:WD40 repeat protein
MSALSRSVRVFLSSTFRDFAEERDLLVRKVFPELRRRARERNVEVIDIDLRWGITPEQAERGEVLPICLAEIDRARPYFFGFIGDRYGWVPEANHYDPSLLVEQPWLDEHRGGKSVTELEMLHGVLNNPGMAGRAFFYFRDTQYSQAKGSVYLSEGEEHRAKLELLKGRIRESGFPLMEEYPSPEVLAARVQEDLWRVIDEAFPMESVPDPVAMERRKHEVYGAARLGLYLGGEKYFAALNEAMDADPFNSILITGPSGGGKSALVANWVERYATAHQDAWVITHYLGSSADAADPVRMVYRIEREIAQVIGENEKLEVDPNKILQQFPEWLSRASAFAEEARRDWIIVLDGLDKLSSRTELRWWPSELPSRVKMVASCLDGEIQSKFKARMKPCEVAVHPLNAQDGWELIRTYLARFNKVLPEPDVERIVAHPLGGSPLFLRTVAEEMRVFGVHEQVQQRLGGYLESQSMGELFAKVFARVEEDNKREDMEGALSVLWGALESFAEDELLAVTGLAPAAWSSILNALQGSLICNDGRIAFGHDYLRKAVEDRYVGVSEKQSAVMRKLADFCAERMRREGRKANSPYVRRQAARHFIIAEQWDEAVSALSDLEFIEARSKAEELVDMMVDYVGVIKLLPEGQKQRETDASRQAELDRFARESAEYAAAIGRISIGSREPEPARPQQIKSVRLWTQREISTARRRMTEAPNRLDVVKAFRVFVGSHVAPLQSYAVQEGFVANLARNDAPAGPVHKEGQRRLEPLGCIKLMRQFAPEEMYNPLPACQAVFEGHRHTVSCVVFCADSRRAVSSSWDNTLRIWNIESGECTKVLEGHSDWVNHFALSANDRLIVSGSNDGTVRLWDLDSGECIKILEVADDYVYAVAFSPDGRSIVTGGSNLNLRVWNINTGECLKILEGHLERVATISLSADGRRIISGSDDKTLRVWDAETGECIRVLDGHLGGIKSAALSADGRRIISAGEDKTLRIWDVETGECVKVLSGHSACVWAVVMSANGRYIVSGGHDETLRVWDFKTGECVRTLAGHTHGVFSLHMTPDAQRIVSGSGDMTVRVWEIERGNCSNLLERRHTGKIDRLALTQDGRQVVSGSWDNTLRIWNMESGQCLRVFSGHTSDVSCAAISSDGRHVVSGSVDTTVRIWDLKSGECRKVLAGHSDTVSCIAFSTCGNKILSGSYDQTVRVWDIKSGLCNKIIECDGLEVDALAVVRNETSVILGESTWQDEDYAHLRILNYASGETFGELEGHTAKISSIRIGIDNKKIVSGSWDKTIRVWDLESGECTHAFYGNTALVNSISIDSKKDRVFSGSLDGTIRVWDLLTGRLLYTTVARGIRSLEFSSLGDKIAAGFSDGKIQFFDIIN